VEDDYVRVQLRDAMQAAGRGRPLPIGEFVIGGRDGVSGSIVCAGFLPGPRPDDINIVTPPEAATTSFGVRIPPTSVWMSSDEEGRPALVSWLGEDHWSVWDSCSAGTLDGTYYAVTPASASPSGREILWRNDAVTGWVEEPMSGAFPRGLTDVRFAGDRVFVASEHDGLRELLTTTDFRGWEPVRTGAGAVEADPGDSGPIWDIRATDFGWLATAVGEEEVYASTDGVMWDRVLTPGPFGNAQRETASLSVGYANGLFVLTETRVGEEPDTIPDWIGRLIKRPE